MDSDIQFEYQQTCLPGFTYYVISIVVFLQNFVLIIWDDAMKREVKIR
jgi:hypothetical protein